MVGEAADVLVRTAPGYPTNLAAAFASASRAADTRRVHLRTMLQGAALHAAVAEILARHLDPAQTRAWIIGSEALGSARPGADIDEAVEGTAPVNLSVLALLRNDLEDLPTLLAFDLVNLQRTTNAFRSQALRTAIPLQTGEGGNRTPDSGLWAPIEPC